MAFDGDVQLEVELNTEPADDGGIEVSVLPLQHASVTWGTYPYSCKHCGAQWTTMNSLREHAKERHGTCLAWHCADCDTKLENFHHFVEHVRGHREELKQYCPHCGVRLDDPNHSGHAGIVYCGFCGEMNPDFNKYGHQLKFQGTTTSEITERSFRPLRILKYRIEEITCWSNYPHVCSYCNTKYMNRWILRRHFRKIHKKCFGLVCIDCLQDQTTFHQFVAHVRKHRPVLESNCEYCDTRLADENQYLTHFTAVHKQDHQCNTCGEYFESEAALNEHNTKYNDEPANVACVDLTRETVSPKAKLACNVCGKIYVSHYHLTMHKMNHEIGRCVYEKNICNYCGKHYAQKTQLIVHIAKKHDKNIGGYNCRFCNKKFYIKSVLDMHVNKIHLANKFECADCNSRFRILRDLKRHMTLWHANTKYYPCQYCNLSFKRESCLRKHQSLHTGLKPFYCSNCKINFESCRMYRKHIKNKQKYGDVKSNFCALCNMSYGFPGNYKKHMKVVHNVRSFKPILSVKCKSRRKSNFCSICDTDFGFPENYQNHIATMHSDENKPSSSIQNDSQTAQTSSSVTLTPEQIFPTIDYSTLPACSSQMDPQEQGIPSLNTLATNSVTQNMNIDTTSNPDTNETNLGNILDANNIAPAEGTVSDEMNPQEYLLVPPDYFIPLINEDDLNVNENAIVLNPDAISQALNTNSTLVLLGSNTLYCSPISIDIDTMPAEATGPSAEENIGRCTNVTSPMMGAMTPESDSNELLADIDINQNDPANNTADDWLALDPDIYTPPGSDFIFDEDVLMPELDFDVPLDFDKPEIYAAPKYYEVPLENIEGEEIEEIAIDPYESSADEESDEGFDDSNSSYASSNEYCVKKEVSRDLNSNILFEEIGNNEPDDE